MSAVTMFAVEDLMIHFEGVKFCNKINFQNFIF